MNFKRCSTEWRQYCQLWQIFIMFKHKKIPLIISTRTNTQKRLVCHELKLRTNVRSWFRWIHFSQKMTHCFLFHNAFVLKRSEDIRPQCKMRAQGHSVIRICDVACDGFVHLQRDVRATCNPPIGKIVSDYTKSICANCELAAKFELNKTEENIINLRWFLT